VGKIAEKTVCSVFFDNMALYFECRISKTHWRFDPLGKNYQLLQI